MHYKEIKVVADYITRYTVELTVLTFEPEKRFETMIEYEDGNGGSLICGSINVVR